MHQLIKAISFSLFSMTIMYTAQANETHHNMSVKKNNTMVGMDEQMVKTTYKSMGIIKGIDNDQQKISISHEAIPDINWPPMTMNFIFTPIADKIKTLKSGDEINFTFTQQGNDYILQNIDVQ